VASGQDGGPSGERRRPEAASGAASRPVSDPAGPGQHGSAQAAEREDGVPDPATKIRPSEVLAFRPQPELASYLDAGPEPDPFFDEPEDDESGSSALRSLIARGWAIPRLPRVRRSGAAPGA
jgi:hypothetical protein